MRKGRHGAAFTRHVSAGAGNAGCERFIRTLKQGEIYIRDYEDFADAQRSIERFIEVVYNHKCLHSALGYVPPAEFERSLHEPKHVLALT